MSSITLVNIFKTDLSTLDSGIDITPWINVAPGTFGKNIKHSPLNKRSPP